MRVLLADDDHAVAEVHVPVSRGRNEVISRSLFLGRYYEGRVPVHRLRLQLPVGVVHAQLALADQLGGVSNLEQVIFAGFLITIVMTTFWNSNFSAEFNHWSTMQI